MRRKDNKLPRNKQRNEIKKYTRIRKRKIKQLQRNFSKPRKCTYCGGKVEYVDVADMRDRTPAHRGHTKYQCVRCHARVTCHLGTNIPMGTLANHKMRRMRSKLHKKFDALWNTDKERNALYKRLAKELGLKNEREAHIGCITFENAKKALYIFDEMF